jgi:hypothetical protein
MADAIRFTDILTTAAGLAAYLGEPIIGPGLLLGAIDVLLGRAQMEDFGRPRSPLERRPPAGPLVAPEVRALVRTWFERLGSDARAELAGEELVAFTDGVPSLGGQVSES